jgi:nicotinamide phosphoribosyltransferase
MSLKFNPILATDSYKSSHSFSYPDSVIGMHSYIEARTRGQHLIVPFGLQMWLQKFLLQRITEADIDEAADFFSRHGEPFNRKGWEKVVAKYDGFLPVTIWAVPEGLPVPSGNVLVTIECADPDLFWLSSYLETALQRGVWYPTTIATLDRSIKLDIKRFYEVSGADMSLLPFSLHDFGGRGVTCAEQAEVGGAAHLVSFMGSDTVEGVRAANYYYSDPMAGFSVPATEHSVQCSFGSSLAQQTEYLRHQLKYLAKPGGIVSIVLDGYDVYREAETLCTTLRDEVIACGAKVVFRPDSGDPIEVIPRLLRLAHTCFGATRNEKGYLKLNNIGIIQGDGVDHMSIKTILGNIVAMGYSADNVIFGSGGSLLQKVNRDTFKFAQKASAILVRRKPADPMFDDEREEVWVGISKDPITDPGKASKKGRLTLVRSRVTGQLQTVSYLNNINDISDEFDEVMRLVYRNGEVYNQTTLTQVRERAKV